MDYNALLELAILYLYQPVLITLKGRAKAKTVSKTGQFKSSPASCSLTCVTMVL